MLFYFLVVLILINAELLVDELYTKGFHIIDNFLDRHHYQALIQLAVATYEQGLFKSAKIGAKHNHQQNNTIRNDEICWLDEEHSNPAIAAYFQHTTEIANILNQQLFLGLIEFETHFASYQAGAFYKKHVDQFTNTKTRKISCVYYLNQDWQPSYGGELLIYNKGDSLIESVVPDGNRFICFTSDLPHEVCLTQQTRYSISGWMKTRPL